MCVYGCCSRVLSINSPQSKEEEEVLAGISSVVVDRQLTPLIGAMAAQQIGLINVNTQNVKITEPPERPKTGVKSVQTADEIVAGYPKGVSKRARSTTRNSPP